MSGISARELRAHFGPRTHSRYLTLAATIARIDAARRAIRPVSTLEATAAALQLDSLTVTPDAMRGHYIARARILDLQPSQMVAAICRVEAQIRQTYPDAHRTGWSGACDGLTLYFASHEAA
jgi:hypothetical protein